MVDFFNTAVLLALELGKGASGEEGMYFFWMDDRFSGQDGTVIIGLLRGGKSRDIFPLLNSIKVRDCSWITSLLG